MATARPETPGRKPRDEEQHEQTESASAAVERLVYTVPEAGGLLGLSRNASYQAAKRGEIPTIRVGGRLIVPKVAFHRMLEGYRVGNADQEDRFEGISALERHGRRFGGGGS
jgi:excisionase family DNA binding protein